MKAFFPHIDYFCHKCVYSIVLSKYSQVLLDVQDIHTRKTASLIITNQMLKQYNLTTEELLKMVTRQIIHQGNFKKNLLRHENDTIYFCFDYPKCAMKEICFDCQWVHDATANAITDETTRKFLQTLEKQMEVLISSSFIKYEKQLSQKMELLYTNIKDRIQYLAESKMRELTIYFADYSAEIMNWKQEQCKKSLMEATDKLIDFNYRCFDEFRNLTKGLETSIFICDQNIKGISNRVQDIQTTIISQTDMTEKDYQEVRRRLSELEASVTSVVESKKSQGSETKHQDSMRGNTSFFQQLDCSQKYQNEKEATPKINNSQENPSLEESPYTYIPMPK